MKNLNLIVSVVNSFLALAGIFLLLGLAVEAFPAATPVVADMALVLFVGSCWMAVVIFEVAKKAWAPIIFAVPCCVCGRASASRQVCNDCIDRLS